MYLSLTCGVKALFEQLSNFDLLLPHVNILYFKIFSVRYDLRLSGLGKRDLCKETPNLCSFVSLSIFLSCSVIYLSFSLSVCKRCFYNGAIPAAAENLINLRGLVGQILRSEYGFLQVNMFP